MDKYYYLVAQLPTLSFATDAKIEAEEFLRQSRPWTDARLQLVLERVRLDDMVVVGGDPAVLRRYKVFEGDLRRQLAAYRRARRDGSASLPPLLAEAAIEEGNPLDIEKRLMKLRWDFVEELDHEHYFDGEFLILYLLKLKILERLSSFERDRGAIGLRQLCEVAI